MMMDDTEDVEATIERLQREWLLANGDDIGFNSRLEPYKPSYCYGCARTAGVAVYRKPQPDKKRKGGAQAASKGPSLKPKQTKARPTTSNLKVSAKIKKKALTTLLGQKTGRASHLSSEANGTRKPLAGNRNEYICIECGKVLANNRNLKRHRLLHTDEAQTAHLGQKMGRANHPSSKANGTRKLLAERNKREECICNECGKVFANKANLKRHQQVHLKVVVDAVYSCTECGETFLTEKPYLQHLQDHETTNIDNGDRPYTDDGDQPYTDDGDRPYTDDGERPYTDDGDRPYTCDECDKTFSRFVYLRQHKKIHNTNRPFGCQYCPRRFKTERFIRIHEMTHMSVLPYPCEICEISFARNSYLKLHQQTHLL